MPSIVTLTTDFEEREPFVAVVKGVLYTQCPGVQVVDLGHHIPRSDLMEGALFLATAIPHFPKGTVHLAGVAPGPAPIAVSINEQIIVCPDNGLITILAERHGIAVKRAITIPDALNSSSGQIFFGRDVFAPTAARLAAGASLEEVGEPLEDVALLEFPRPQKESGHRVVGQIVHIDRFGNLMSNVHRSFLDGLRVTNVEVGHFPVGGLSERYSDVDPGKPLALFGISGYLEIAYNEDRADTRLRLGKGIVVSITVEPQGT